MKYSNSIWLVTIALVAVMMSCKGGKQDESEGLALVTERQECVLKHFTHMKGDVSPLTIAIDIPVEGSQAMVDNLVDFFNETLYAFFDNGEDCHLSYESVFSTDVKQLIGHYQEAYAPFFSADCTAVHEFATDCLEINLVAQTNTYVTYEVNNIFFGEGVETAKEWVTFVKSDGHRLAEVINDSEMLRFYREQPELRSDVVWENLLSHCDEGDNLCGVVCTVGLLNDSVVHQYVYAPGIFEDIKYPIDGIAPYLTQEAQELVQNRNND